MKEQCLETAMDVFWCQAKNHYKKGDYQKAIDCVDKIELWLFKLMMADMNQATKH